MLKNSREWERPIKCLLNQQKIKPAYPSAVAADMWVRHNTFWEHGQQRSMGKSGLDYISWSEQTYSKHKESTVHGTSGTIQDSCCRRNTSNQPALTHSTHGFRVEYNSDNREADEEMRVHFLSPKECTPFGKGNCSGCSRTKIYCIHKTKICISEYSALFSFLEGINSWSPQNKERIFCRQIYSARKTFKISIYILHISIIENIQYYTVLSRPNSLAWMFTERNDTFTQIPGPSGTQIQYMY